MHVNFNRILKPVGQYNLNICLLGHENSVDQ
jgi:hypothetical protein